MGRVPLPPPPRFVTGERQLQVWRDQRHKRDLEKRYQDRNTRSSSWMFWYALAVLSPWIISVVVKVWTGEWVVW